MGYCAVPYKELPDVCRTCRFRDFDAADEYSNFWHYCTKGLYIPTKKNSCKVKDKQLRKEQEK